MTFDRDHNINAQVSSYSGADAVTPNDGADLTRHCQGLWIGGAGTGLLRIVTLAGDLVNFVGVPVGLFKVGAARVHATGTGVTSIVALYY